MGSDSRESACNAGDQVRSLGREDPGEGNGYPLQHSYLRSPWTEEPGGLQSMGLQKVGHDSETGSVAPNARGLGSILGQGTRFHMPQLKNPT